MKLIDKKNKIIKVEKDDLKDAKLSSLDFSDIETRKRAYANVLGARLAMKMLFSQKIEATNLYSLYTIHNVLEKFDIADIYFQNIKIDIRLVFSPNEIFIPKTHFDYGLTPDIYLVLLARENLSAVEFLGFFDTDDLNKENFNKDFYFYEYDLLQKPEKLKNFLENYTPKNHFNTPEPISNELEELLLAFVDGETTEKDSRFVIEQLAVNFSLREKLVEFENFELMSKEIAKNENLLQDGFLEIVGAQKIFEEEENGPQSFQQAKAEIRAEVLSDILDADVAASAAGLAAGLAGGLAASGLAAETDLTPLPDFDGVNGLTLGEENETSTEETSFADEAGSVDEGFNDALPPFDDDSAFLELEENVPAYLKQAESPVDTIKESLPEVEGFQSEDFDDALPALDISEKSEFGELPELEGFNQLEEPQENLINEDENENVNKKEEVVDIENFDFDMLNEDKPIEKEDLAYKKNDSLMPLEDKEFDALQEFSKLESEEEVEPEDFPHEQPRQESAQSDDLIFQVEEFLSSVELSDEQKNALENTLTSGVESTQGLGVSAEEDSDVIFLPNEDEQDELIDGLVQSGGQDGIKNENDLLQVLFEKEQINEDNPPKTPKENILANLSKNKKMVIAASVASVVLVTFVAGGAIISHKGNNTNMQPSQMQAQGQPGQAPMGTDPNNIQDGMNQQNPNQPAAQQGLPPIDQALAQGPQEIPGESQASAGGDMGKAVSDAFLSEPVNASISKVAWEVPEDLAYNDSFRKYLQMAGRNLKLNLQNNLLLATEMAYSNKVIVDLNINANGSLQSSNVSVSSGSKQIDKIVLQSVKDTLSYLKMPSSELSGRSSVLTLIINF